MDNPRLFVEEEEGIDLQKWFYRIIDNWAVFLLFIVISVGLAFVYNKITVKEYELSTSVLIKENTNPLDKTNLVKVSLYSDPYRLENEIGIINSTGVKKRTLENLGFFVEYYKDYAIQSAEIYRNSPFTVAFDTIHCQPANVAFKIRYITDSLINIKAEGEDVSLYNFKMMQNEGFVKSFSIDDTVKLGDTLRNVFMKFSLIANFPGIISGYKSETYTFYFRPMLYLLQRYGNVKVDIPNGSSIMTVSLRHSNPEKAAVYLNSLMQNYLEKGIERENQIAQKTINFIDSQLSTLGDSLHLSEQRLEDFRSTNKLVDFDYQAQQAYTRQNELDKQKASLTIQQKYLEYLEKNLRANSLDVNELIAPTTLGISDAVLNNLVLELVNLYSERTELTLNTKKNTPYITSIDTRIEALKAKLYETVTNIYNATNISLKELKTQMADVSDKLSLLPKNQRTLLNFQRIYQLNDQIYTYLLTQRSEMQIKKASNLPSNEILEVAEPDEATLVHPNKKVILLIALLLGFFIPFGVIYLRVVLNNKIQSLDEIKAVTEVPVVGTIFENDEIQIPAVLYEPNSIVAESFRMLRANMQFVFGDQKSPVLVVSSAMKGEGKSYVAINIAAVYASYNKKVCLVDLDLRRPKLANYLDAENKLGMSNYFAGQAKIEDIIMPACNKMFDLIPSGPIPPNPSEMVASNKLEELMAFLKERYDIIILDTPPIGMVSDAMFISKVSGFMLLVIRHNVTHKHLLSLLFEDLKRNQAQGLNLVYNDVPAGKKGYYRYGYRYGYYYTSEQKGFWNRLFK